MESVTATDWLDGLPEEARAYAAAKGWGGPAAAVESYRQLERLLGADKAGRGLVLPKGPEDVEGWRAVHARLGCPEAPEAYELDLPETVAADQATAEFRSLAHELGLSLAQVKRLTGWWRGRLEAAAAAGQARSARGAREAEALLRERWGEEYELRRADAERARRRFTRRGDEGLADLEALMGRPAAVAMLAEIGAALAEDRFAGGGETGFAMSPEEARRELEALQHDNEFMAGFLDRNHPDHRRHVLRARRLNRIAVGLGPEG